MKTPSQKQIAIAVHEHWKQWFKEQVSYEEYQSDPRTKDFCDLSEELQALDYIGLYALERVHCVIIQREELLKSMQIVEIKAEALAEEIHKVWSWMKKEMGWKSVPLVEQNPPLKRDRNDEEKLDSLIDLEFELLPKEIQESNLLTATMTLNEIERQGFILIMK